MAKIENKPFVAYPVELVPSAGINEIMDNQKNTSNELWTLLGGIMEGAPEFAAMLFSDKFNVTGPQKSSDVQFEYDQYSNIKIIRLGVDRVVAFEYDHTGALTGIENGVIAINLTMLIDNLSVTKRFEFIYDNTQITNIKLTEWQGV